MTESNTHTWTIRFFHVATAIVAATSVGACGDSEDGASSASTDNALCESSVQQLPADCDANRVCNGVQIPADPAACSECLDTAAMLNQARTPLTECACSNCAVYLAACFQSAQREADGDAARDAACRSVVECAQANDCAGTDCYCGIGVTVEACLATPAQGPCAQEIATAAGCELADALCVAAAQANTATALGRANAVSVCTFGNPDPMAPVTGACSGI